MFRTFGWSEAWFIIMAVRWTLALSAIAFTSGALGGLLVALCRTSAKAPLRYGAQAFIRVFQGTPLLLQLFVIFFGLNVFGIVVQPLTAAAIALALHASAYLGEIWRGCIEAVPNSQAEASWSLGLGYFDRMRFITLPQAARIAVAPTVGFLVLLLKETSLASIIGFVELTRAGQIINTTTFEPFRVFALVAAVYFILCWPLSLLAKRMERYFARVL